ncbi:superinfection immunity protein [Pseudomonas cremoricolorata]|uniref:Iduronate sulfatase n=1 Tax=Pseudomonas cremoricolorata TaxID=157783 RepID=A0A089WVB4_9PSED|nr:superinfection immunity protein [Pseudomonas cremoricolorata]AIR90527.1 iduronate sulfatase [Pseudomonas cremoricolorata]
MLDTGTAGALMLGIMGFVIYFLPTINAKSRKHPNRGSIFALNLFLGWTLIGWVAAVVWSASSINKDVKQMPGSSKYKDLDRLVSMKERGHITDDEFEIEKKKLLGG